MCRRLGDLHGAVGDRFTLSASGYGMINCTGEFFDKGSDGVAMYGIDRAVQ